MNETAIHGGSMYIDGPREVEDGVGRRVLQRRAGQGLRSEKEGFWQMRYLTLSSCLWSVSKRQERLLRVEACGSHKAILRRCTALPRLCGLTSAQDHQLR